MTEQTTSWREEIPLRKLGRLSKAYVAGKLQPLTDCMGGNVYHEGKLYMMPKMEKDEYKNLSSSRQSRLVRDVDDFIIGLEEIDEVKKGRFYNAQEETSKADFIRDDLLEPVDSSVSISLFKNDIVLHSKRIRDRTDFTISTNLGGSDFVVPDKEPKSEIEAYLDESDDGLVAEQVASREKGKRSGSRAAITELTKTSSNKMKFTLRNSLCPFEGFVTLTYPRRYPRDGRTCKKHLNQFLNHLRKDYPGIKYFWFMEFQERGAPHFHVFMSCLVPGKTYTSPLWYRIVNSKDSAHLKAGTNVVRLRRSEDVVKYATSYAKKATQKMTPDDFSRVGRFWGCSRKLCDAVMVLSDVSIRQIQELWSCYYEDIGFDGKGLRLDKFNGYIWNGRRYAAMLSKNYYDSHLRPAIAEAIMLSRPNGKSIKGHLFKEEDIDFMSRLRSMKKRRSAGSSIWKDLTEDEFNLRLKKGTERLKGEYGGYHHSLSSAYEGIDEVSYNESGVSVNEWAIYLAYLQLRLNINWIELFKPLMRVWAHTHITLFKDGRTHKRKYQSTFVDAVLSKNPYKQKDEKPRKEKKVKRFSSNPLPIIPY